MHSRVSSFIKWNWSRHKLGVDKTLGFDLRAKGKRRRSNLHNLGIKEDFFLFLPLCVFSSFPDGSLRRLFSSFSPRREQENVTFQFSSSSFYNSQTYIRNGPNWPEEEEEGELNQRRAVFFIAFGPSNGSIFDLKREKDVIWWS